MSEKLPQQRRKLEWISSKFHEYCIRPPKRLVDEELTLASSSGQSISYDEAEKRVALFNIVEYLRQETNEVFSSYRGD